MSSFHFSSNVHCSLLVDVTAIECEHRWRYLRDRYTRERKRKSQQQTGQTISKAGNWPLAKQMHFIQDFIKHRRYYFFINANHNPAYKTND